MASFFEAAAPSMFLFTTPPPPAPPPVVQSAPASPAASLPSSPVTEAIRRGAEQTGTSYGYLLTTAQRESALDPSARAPTSTATGLFQFIEQTWLGLIKRQGGKVGLPDLADSIAAREDGRFTVEDTETRQTILKLREDPGIASVMAGAFTQQNRDALSGSLGREPSAGELYMAHMLGARGAAALIRSAADTPVRPASFDLPEAAAANRAVFYDRGGRARTAAEVYEILAASRNAAAAAPSSFPAGPASASPTADADPPLPKLEGPALYGLFQTGTRSGPLVASVARIWRVNNAPTTYRPPSAAFFPRSDTVAAPDGIAAPVDIPAATVSSEAAPGAVPAPSAAVAGTTAGPLVAAEAAAPLPPPRPRFAEASGAYRLRRAAPTVTRERRS